MELEKDEHSLCKDLNHYLKGRYGYRKDPAYVCHRGKIGAHRSKFDLYFRTNPVGYFWPEQTLIIARIGFKDVQKGHGANLMTFLCRIADKYGYNYIGLERVNDNSKAFALKLGFCALRSNSEYVVSVEKLARILKMKTFS